MPTLLTIPLTASERLFFDEAWPLEEMFLDILAGAQPPEPGDHPFKPYTLSPLWRRRGDEPAAAVSNRVGYQWRVGLLDDRLAQPFLKGLEATERLDLNGRSLAVEPAGVEMASYEQLARTGQARAGAKDGRYFDLEFVTPVILRRRGLPFPLPDPVLIFHHYLLAWDAFAPRELRININALDAVAVHLALIDHRLETRRVRPKEGPLKTGFLGQATYKLMAGEKLGPAFLGRLQTLARFGRFCGTGELTECGLGQTRVKGN